MLVDLTVGDLDGVEEVHTDHATGDTVVRFDSDAVSVDQIVDAIRGVGYDAEPAL
jgi:copper chaperone CopZ